METETHTLETPDVDLVYEVRSPASVADGRLPLLMIGHPMDARGFDTLATFFEDRDCARQRNSFDTAALQNEVRVQRLVHFCPPEETLVAFSQNGVRTDRCDT